MRNTRGRVPNVNASLIHEARMLFQQFLGGRQENYYSMRIAEAQAKGAAKPPVCLHPVLLCGLCTSVEPRIAEFIINGFSVCGVHKTKAQGATNRPRFPGE